MYRLISVRSHGHGWFKAMLKRKNDSHTKLEDNVFEHLGKEPVTCRTERQFREELAKRPDLFSPALDGGTGSI